MLTCDACELVVRQDEGSQGCQACYPNGALQLIAPQIEHLHCASIITDEALADVQQPSPCACATRDMLILQPIQADSQ